MISAGLRGSLVSSTRALRHRNFRLWWSGQIVSLVGTWMQSVAQGWLMHRLTSSPAMLGFLGAAQFLPVLLLSLWAGTIADRVDRRRMVTVTQAAALLQACLLAGVVSAGVVEPWMVLALASVFGVINAFDLPARQSLVVELVGKDDLSNGIALNSAAFNTARIVGPAAAGLILAAFGEAACFWVNALSYTAILAGLARMDPARRAVEGAADASAPSTLLEGLRYAAREGPIRNLLLLLGVCAGLGFQYMVLLPVYAREILQVGPEGYGLLVSAFGVGSILAAIRLTREQSRWDLRRNLLLGLCAGGVGLGAFAWSRAFALSLAAGFLAGFGLILYVISTNTLLQITTEDRFRGRVMSLYTVMFVGTSPLGSLLAGSVAEAAGAPAATSVSAAVLLGGAAWVSYRLRVLAAREAGRPTLPLVTEKMG